MEMIDILNDLTDEEMIALFTEGTLELDAEWNRRLEDPMTSVVTRWRQELPARKARLTCVLREQLMWRMTKRFPSFSMTTFMT
eukprot:scaffold600_cov193-Ochromonas_danica.AAC.12